MAYYTEDSLMNRVREHAEELEKMEKDYFFVALQGSWNYGLGYEGSDVDTKALILPSFKDIVMSKEPISTTHVLENNEHIDMKDIRVMFQNFWKQNINFLEILFTDYVVVNPMYIEEYKMLTAMAEEIAKYDIKKALNCMSGMAQEKYHAMEHPYPAVVDKIEKFGYDGKQLHHILRLTDFISAYVRGKSFKSCLTSFDVYSKEDLMRAKRNEFTLEEARMIAKANCDAIHEVKEYYLAENKVKVNKETRAAAEDVLYRVLEKRFRYELSI